MIRHIGRDDIDRGQHVNALLIGLHIVGAVFIVGPMAALPMLALPAIRSRDPKTVARLARGTNLFSLLSVAVFALGFGGLATANAREHLTILTPWVAASAIIYLVAVSLSLFVTVPVMRSEAALLASDSEGAAFASSRGYHTISIASGVAAIGLGAVVVLMIWKP